MLTLYIVRHGEYDGNVERHALTGRSDVRPLNPTGIIQARNVARFLSDHPIEHMFASPVTRARQTAEILASDLKSPVCLDERLSEIDYGILEGKTFSEISTHFGHLRKDWEKSDRFTLRIPEGESFEEMFERVENFIHEFILIHNGITNQQYVIVTHLAVIHALIIIALARPKRTIFEIEKEFPVGNTTITKIVVTDEGEMELKYAGKSFAYPPKIIRSWLMSKYPGLKNLHLYTGFSQSFVLSFDTGDQTLNMKLYTANDEAVAMKGLRIHTYIQENVPALDFIPAQKRIHTPVESFPVAVVRTHLPSEKMTAKELQENQSFAVQASQILQRIHRLIPVSAVQTFWQSQEYQTSVADEHGWSAFLDEVIAIRLRDAESIHDAELMQLIRKCSEWITDHRSEIKQSDIVPLHGDYYPSNFCFEKGKITAIIDFDLAMIGHTMWELGISRQRSETYMYPQFADHLETNYGVSTQQKQWILLYTLLESIGSCIHNMQSHSFQQNFDRKMIKKYTHFLQ